MYVHYFNSYQGPTLAQYTFTIYREPQTGAPSYRGGIWAAIDVRYVSELRAAAGRLAPGALVIGSCFPMRRRYVGV